MFNKLLVLSTISLLVLFLACTSLNDKVEDVKLIGKGEWSIVKSPLTDKCYETFDSFGLMGMAEVDCIFLSLDQLK